MKPEICRLYPFLKAAQGNWRNAMFIHCLGQRCAVAPDCTGFLLCADAAGKPLVISAKQFSHLTGEPIEPSECAAILDKAAFDSAYALWLAWTVEDPHGCTCLQVADTL